MSSPNRIQGLWNAWHAARQGGLNRVRKCARLTMPWLLPDEGFSDDDVLHEPFQNDGAMFVEQATAWLFEETFTPGSPWFMLEIDPEILFDPSVDQMTLRAIEEDLSRRELAITAAIESVRVRENIHSHRLRTFYSAAEALCEQLVYSGDTLVRIGDNKDPIRNPVADDFRLRVYRRDEYVIRRDPAGDVMDIITKERADARLLSDEVLAKAEIDKAVLDDPDPRRREFDLYTHISRQRDHTWLITQELKGIEIAESHETVNPFLSAPWKLPPCAHYGRGPIETRLGGLGSMDALSQAMLDWSAMKSDFKYFLDSQSKVRDVDLFGRPGGVVRGARVSGGVVQDVAVQSAANTGDFSEVSNHYDRLTADFRKASQSHQGTQPTGERVTKYQSSVIANETERNRSGGMIPLEESIQQPLIQRVMHMLKRDHVLAPLRMPSGKDVPMKVAILTGMAQRRRAQKAGAIVEVAQLAGVLGPDAQATLDPAQAFRAYLRYRAFYEPGVVKSEAQRAAERQAAFNQGVAAEATKEAISVAGDGARARTEAALAGAV